MKRQVEHRYCLWMHRMGRPGWTAQESLDYGVSLVVHAPDECAICLRGFPDVVAVYDLPCGHVFHAACLRIWLARHLTCPMCRRSIWPWEQ